MTDDRGPDPEPPPVIRRTPGYGRPVAHPPAAPPAPKRPARNPPPARPDRGGRRRARAWGRRIPLILLTAVLLVTAAILGDALWLDRTLHRERVLADYPGRPAPGRGSNWLLVGSDSRQGLTPERQQLLTTGGDIGNGRTDTLLLVHLPGLGSPARPTLVSIPRDSYVPIPGYGRDKVNAAFVRGGAPLLAQTVEQATGLRLDHYAEVGFSGFAELVDALGGVTVCPAAPISDPLAGIDLPAGCQRLDGRTGLGYVRTRATPRADLDRMINQRRLMAALLRRAASPTVWLDPRRWYSVPHAAADALTVNQGDHVWDLARLGWSLHGPSTAVTVPIGELTSSAAGSVVIWDHDAAARLFDALGADAPVPPDISGEQP